MSLIKARGIIIREVFVGESDKIITIFAKDLGKISVRARGARKSKSKFLAGTQLFTYSDFIIFTRNKYYTLSQVEIIEGFYNIRNDYDKLCYANYFLEIIDKSIMAGMESNDILLLLLKTLKVMCSNKINIVLLGRIYELKFLDYSGYRPEVNECIACNSINFSGNIYFRKEGIVCNNCNSLKDIKLNEATIYAIRYILNSNLTELYNFKLDTHSLKSLQSICRLLMHSLDIRLNSSTFISM